MAKFGVEQAVAVHPEKSGMDKMRDNRVVLAKGAGPGVWNRWVSHCSGYRVFWSNVDRAYGECAK